MSAVGLESIEHTVQLTHKWINDLDARLGWGDKHRSFRLLRTVLQALGDWLSVNAAAGFGSQPPEPRGNSITSARGPSRRRSRSAARPISSREWIKRSKQTPSSSLPLLSRLCSNFCPTKSRLVEIEHVRHLCRGYQSALATSIAGRLKRIRRAEMTSRQERQPCSRMSW